LTIDPFAARNADAALRASARNPSARATALGGRANGLTFLTGKSRLYFPIRKLSCERN